MLDKLGAFPNLSANGSYAFISQIMNFNNMSKRQFDDVVQQMENRDFDIATMNSASTIVHEASHYFDNLATLTGQVMLTKVYNALNELENRAEPNEMIALFNMLASWSHKHYTASIVQGIHDPEPKNWSYDLNVGFGADLFGELNGEMFLFAIFKYYGEFIGNVPFSIEALWETNAMWAEITYHIYAAYALDNEVTTIIESNRLDKLYRDYIYNSETLVYSIAAHFTSSFFDYGDIYRSFKLSKALSSISLNLPYRFYSQLKRPQGSLFRGYANQLLDASRDLNPCAVFLALLENVVESGANLFHNEENYSLDIDQILAINGLPDKESLKNEVLSDMHQLNIDSANGLFAEVYAVQKNNGIHLLDVYGIEGGLNVHPACFIDIANKSQSVVFQRIRDDEIEAGSEEESEAFTRYHDYGNRERLMRQIIAGSRP
ncbi:hypothetical protein K0T92_11290 [Paenibacillus oenotherae]|uniref:Uncharacterized protein n=1 Tax=Paenibacillus oenotherae TaxID=1435645 RepID=A0ABS7D6B6_9BACL|nr:hypothetical protein [Paenibacillus oenotherae]MBW7475333.1 hypothetical protein [Paenibacillus oenotherae]